MNRRRRAAWLVSAVMAVGCAPALHRDRPARLPEPASVVAAASAFPSIRSEDPSLTALLDEAVAQSATLARLVREVAAYRGIVYIQIGRCPVRGLKGCLLHIVQDADPMRYLWIRVEAADDRLLLVSTLAHELQHAVEVLEHPGIRTSREMVQFYRSFQAEAFGVALGPFRSFETAAAIAAGLAVRAELNSHAAAAADDDRQR